MIWLKGDDYYIHTDDGRFTVSKAYVNSYAVYSAWRVRKPDPPKCLLSVATDGSEEERRAAIRQCKEACDGEAVRA